MVLIIVKNTFGWLQKRPSHQKWDKTAIREGINTYIWTLNKAIRRNYWYYWGLLGFRSSMERHNYGSTYGPTNALSYRVAKSIFYMRVASLKGGVSIRLSVLPPVPYFPGSLKYAVLRYQNPLSERPPLFASFGRVNGLFRCGNASL